MKHLLLLGAGFSRNWGGWLAAEAFEYLLGCPEIQKDTSLRSALWKHHGSGGFENALAEIQDAYRRDPVSNRAPLDALQAAISRMFVDMNEGFFKQRFDSHSSIDRSVVHFLSKFDAIFTLNQDLLLEQHYLLCDLSTGPYRNWNGHDLPGLDLAPNEIKHDYRHWSQNVWRPQDPSTFLIRPEYQPLIKLHGSSNWVDDAGGPLLVIGGGKAQNIRLHPILEWYANVFAEALQNEHARLMIIGYGFRDPHINETISGAVRECGLKIFNVSPQGSEQARSLNETRQRGQITAGTQLESLFEQGLIGASRRSLTEIFYNDVIEHKKVYRFFEG